MKLGAFDYITKPFDLDEVRAHRRAGRGHAARRRRCRRCRRRGAAEVGDAELIGRSPAMQEVFETIGRVAADRAPVLITGESGTGKELVASAHPRQLAPAPTGRSSPSTAPPCSETLLESELFGHETGAFTGARDATEGPVRAGRRRHALPRRDRRAWTCDAAGQAAARAAGARVRAGRRRRRRSRSTCASSPRPTATCRALIADGRFREDLYYRLNVVPIELPPLRKRKEDILLIAEHFIRDLNVKFGKNVVGFSPEAADAVMHYDWPGNVRELRNVLERLVLLEDTDLIAPWHLPTEISGRAGRLESGALSLGINSETLSFKAAKEAVLDRFEAQVPLRRPRPPCRQRHPGQHRLRPGARQLPAPDGGIRDQERGIQEGVRFKPNSRLRFAGLRETQAARIQQRTTDNGQPSAQVPCPSRPCTSSAPWSARRW